MTAPAESLTSMDLAPVSGVALDAELRLLMGERVSEFGVLQQRLGRNATDVEADSAPILLLHDGDLLAELCGADCGDVAAGSGAKDKGVEVLSHAVSLPVSLR